MLLVLAAPTASAQNRAPKANDDQLTMSEDAILEIDAQELLGNDEGPANDPPRIVAIGAPSHGESVLTSRGVLYTPAKDFYGVDAFTYTISDSRGRQSTGTVRVTVRAVNDVPIARDDGADTEEEESVDVDVLANDTDVDGDDLRVASVTNPRNGTAVVSGKRTVTYTPESGFSGTDSFSYTVSDGEGGAATATVTIRVIPKNRPPVALDDAAATDEDAAVVVDVLANDSDPDGDDLQLGAVAAPSNGTASVTGGRVRYTPNPDFNGTDSFSYTVNDGRGATATAAVTVTVAPVNDVPTARDDTAMGEEDTAIAVGVLANDSDPDGDDLAVASVTAPANGTAETDGATVTYTPAPNFNGSDAFGYTVSDGNGGTASATVSVTVTAVNDAPTARGESYATPEDVTLTVAAPGVLGDDVDPDGDPLAAVLVEGAANGTLDLRENGSFTYTPRRDFVGTDRFRYQATDGTLSSTPVTVTITIGGQNDAPTAQDDAAETDEDTAVVVDVLANDSDPDNDALTIGSVTQPAHGTATVVGNATVRYTPAANFNGTDTFSYTVNDGQGGTDTATVTVTVAPVNDVPIAGNDEAITDKGTPVVVDVLANDSDPDGDPLAVASVAEAGHGTASILGSTSVQYAPDPTYSGTDSFSYTVQDGRGGTATATISVLVRAGTGGPATVTAAVAGEVRAGEDVVVRASAAGFAPTSGTLHYRPGGAREFEAVPLTMDGDGSLGTIPAEAVTLRGLDYYVVLTDGATSASAPAAAPTATPRHLRVPIDALTAPVPFLADGYRMLALPLTLADAAPSAVFADDFGAYTPSGWRLLRWNPEEDRYAEYPGLGDSLDPGVGFWLAARAGSEFDVEDGLSVAASGPITLTLAPGWNQIGSPFAFPVAWDDIGGHEAVGPPAAWDGAEYALAESVLLPWHGYFVENPADEPVALVVPPIEAAPNGLRIASQTASTGYRLRLRAEAGEFRDTHNVVGFAEGAARGRDAFDLAEPPPPGDHIRLSVVDGDVRLAHSLMPDDGGAAWELEVAASEGVLAGGPRTVTVTLLEDGDLPPGYGRHVLDLDRAVALSVAADRFDVTLTASEPVRRLRVIVGTEAFAGSAAQGLSLVPPAFALDPVHPNPSRGPTALAYQIPEAGPVTLEVFDSLGRRVAVVVDEERDAGRHTVLWDPPGSLASGAYVYRLRAGTLAASGKLVLLR